MAKSPRTAHVNSCKSARAHQASRRQKRLDREDRKLQKKMEKMTRQGRDTSRITKAIDQVEYAGSYIREAGKKGSAGVPVPFEMPHASKPFKGRSIKTTHTRVWGRTAHELKVVDGSWVTNQVFSTYCEKSA